MDDTLRVGDIICLYCEESGGYIYNFSSSAVQNNLYTYIGQSREHPAGIQDPQGITFTVHLRNRYQFNKRYHKLQLAAAVDKSISEAVLSEAKMQAELEMQDNKAEIKRQLGRRIRYGQEIELKHTFSRKYIHVSTTQTSSRDKNNMAVQLHEYSAKNAHFKILPRFKVKTEGDLVQVNDQIVLESVKSPVQFLHCSSVFDIDNFNRGCELNLGIQKSGFTVVRYRRFNHMEDTIIKGGSIVRLYHKEIEAYLAAEGLCHVIQEHIHLRVRPVDPSKPKSQFPPTSASTFWQLESHEGILVGDYLKWGQQLHIRHLTTKDYLALDKEGNVYLSQSNRNPNTVFRLHSVTREEDTINIGSYARMEHVLTERWIHALNAYVLDEPDEPYLRRGDHKNDGLKRDNELLRQVGSKAECMYDDAFTLQEVLDEEMDRHNFIAGFLPLVTNLGKDIGSAEFSAREVVDICQSLESLRSYMLVHGEPNADRQKLLRDLRLVDLLVATLQNSKDRTSEPAVLSICIVCYQALQVYLMGDNRNNELYITQYVDFISSQATSLGGIGKYAMEMVTELFRNNRQIVDTVQHEQIDNFVELAKERKDYRCLEMLAVLCVCDGKTLSDNQTYIAKRWLADARRGTIRTEMKWSDKEKKHILFVSTQHKHWQTMGKFIAEHYQDGNSSEEYRYFESQLDLIGKVCAGRNALAIQIITSSREAYLTWEEAYYCLCEDSFPPSLRASYSDLFIHVFLDVGTCRSVVDGMTLSFVYSELDAEKEQNLPRRRDRRPSLVPEASTKGKVKDPVPMLLEWIDSFLEDNHVMVSSEIEHNVLIEHVLKLLYHLVKFGAYSYSGNEVNIKNLVRLLLALLDGRTDQPFKADTPMEKRPTDSKEAVERFKTELRFCPSPEATALVNAKHQALEVIDLLMTLQFNERLQKFLILFKKVETGEGGTSLQPLLLENCNPFMSVMVEADGRDIYYNLRKQALKNLDKILEVTSFFVTYDIKGILLDLSNYQYNRMMCKSMTLLNTYYSKKDLLCTKAMQVNVLLTDGSVILHKDIERRLPELKRWISSKLQSDQAEEMHNLFNDWAQDCYLDDNLDEIHAINQSIFINFGIPDLLEKIFEHSLQADAMDHKALVAMVKGALRLMRGLIRKNRDMQLKMFNFIDQILELHGAEAEAAVTLAEIFVGNQDACLKVRQSHIQRIVQLAAEHKEKVPELIDLLIATMKMGELNLPLKRNQSFVMKHVMQDYQKGDNFLDKGREERMSIIKGYLGDTHMNYMICLVDLLATCAEGEDLFIQSKCRTIFPLDDLMEILNDPDVPNMCKRPFLRFLFCTYFSNAAKIVDTGVTEIPGNCHFFIGSLAREALRLEKYIHRNPDTAASMLRRAPDKNGFPTKTEKQVHQNIRYFFDAVFPFLEIFYRKGFSLDDYPFLKKETTELGKALMVLSNALGPLVVSPTQSHALVKAVTAVLPLTNAPAEVIQTFITDHGTLKVDCTPTPAKIKYYEEHKEELALNKQLHCFALNIRAAYRGLNTVAEQLGSNPNFSNLVMHLGQNYRILSARMYTDLNSDEALPLGEEFQTLVSCFSQENYIHAKKLINTLYVYDQSMTLADEDSPAEVGLVVTCLQVLRALIHNEERKVCSPRDQIRVTYVQNRLTEFDCVAKTVGLAERNSDEVAREFFAFTNSLLLNANPKTQAAFEKYFIESREEVFFYALKKRIALSALNTVERRFLKAQYDFNIQKNKALTANLQASLEQATENTFFRRYMKKIKKKVFTTSPRVGVDEDIFKESERKYIHEDDPFYDQDSVKAAISEEVTGRLSMVPEYPSRVESMYMPSLSLCPSVEASMELLRSHVERQKEEAQAVGNKEGIGKDVMDPSRSNGTMSVPGPGGDQPAVVAGGGVLNLVKIQDEGCLELVLKLMAGMCDGQNSGLQDYYREQPDNFKSFNLVAETTGFLSLLYMQIEPSNIDLVIQLFVTLNEFASGNAMNVQVIYDSNISEYVNLIIRAGRVQSCEDHKVLELWSAVSILVMSMIEENRPDIGMVQTELKDILDSESIQKISTWAYVQAKRYGNMGESEHLQVGFKFFFMWMRLRDMGAKMQEQEEEFTEEIKEAFAFYNAHSRTIEILKDNELQVLRFRVKDEEVLREEVKEKLKWNIDRSSHNSKLRELMEWSQDIIDDIYYQRKVQAYGVFGGLIKAWDFSNAAVFCLSLLINFIMLATWEAKAYLLTYAPEDTLPPEIHDPVPIVPFWYYTMLYILGSIHNVLSFIVMVTFFVSSRPKLPDLMCFSDWYRASTFFGLKQSIQRTPERPSQLRIHFVSFVTLYYIAFAVFSVLGTSYHGYFFAFHLLNIVYNNQLLQRVIMAVTLNGKSLIWVTLLGAVVMYQFALAAFAYLRYAMDVQRDDASLFCGTLFQCTATVVRYGLVGEIFEKMEVHLSELTFHNWGMLVLFHFVFFVLITTIGLNVIFGIILDTFSELRDNKWTAETDMKSTCFICSKDAHEFDARGNGFEHHVKNEHNMWAYIFFFIHLEATPINDLTNLELYVWEQIADNKYDYFPVNRAMVLQGQEISQSDEKLHEILATVSAVLERLRSEDNKREREQERMRQREWQIQHQDQLNISIYRKDEGEENQTNT